MICNVKLKRFLILKSKITCKTNKKDNQAKDENQKGYMMHHICNLVKLRLAPSPFRKFATGT